MEKENKPFARSQKLTKSSRLKKKKDFKFERFSRFKTEHFVFVFDLSGQGRIGISLSKKFLKSAVARNRVRRLLREAFRKNQIEFDGVDLNVLGSESLTKHWKELEYFSVERQLLAVKDHLEKKRNGHTT